MNKERLLRLAEELRKPELPEGITVFNMSEWWTRHTCGTAACALGVATTIPEFRKAGLRLYIQDYHGVIQFESPYELVSGYTAAADFFEISRSSAIYLFSPSYESNDTRDKVAQRLENFANLRDKERRYS